MADEKTFDEGALISKRRKLDLPNSIDGTRDEDQSKSDSNKKQKIEVHAEKNGSASLTVHENVAESEELIKITTAEEEEDEEEDDEEYNAEEEDEEANEEVENVDRKGKGIMKGDKGKGKLIEDSEDDDSDGRDDDLDDSTDDSGSDFSDEIDENGMEDDPLAEVDLDNILPSRTRQRRMQPGVRIVDDSDKGNDA